LPSMSLPRKSPASEETPEPATTSSGTSGATE
jgi:hypothetical protein